MMLPQQAFIDFIIIRSSMAYRQQLGQFRKDIRRSQLDEIFLHQRIKLLTDTSAPMETEEPTYLKKPDLNHEELKSLARLSQTESGIDIINQANYGDNLLKYVSSQFAGTQEQLMATYALCNLSYKPKAAPSFQMLTAILTLLEEIQSQTVADNLLCTLGNYIYDFQQTKLYLLNQNQLVTRLIALLGRFQNPTASFCSSVSNCILQTLNQANPDKSFLKLRQPLLKFILMAASADTIPIIKQSTYSLCLLAAMYPAELADFIVNGHILDRLMSLYRDFGDLPFVSFMLKIAKTILKDLKPQYFAGTVLPMLDYISSINFQTGKVSSLTSHNLRIDTYKLIYFALEQEKLLVEEFMNSQMGKRMLASFELEDDSDLRRQLVFVFTPVYLTTKNQGLRVQIERAMVRARELDANFELVGHISQLQMLFHR